jgi:DNA-binding transcriptional MerR regulator
MEASETWQGITVGRLARKFGLSRSTLLYYHRIGLLVPSRGGGGDYRWYSPDDVRRMAKIMSYREAGVALKDIRRILDGHEEGLAAVLERRLQELNTEIAGLREQQRIIVGLLKTDSARRQVGVMNRRRWSDLLRAAGFSSADMRRWHRDFESRDPVAHEEFLRFLCIPDDEIEQIRNL